MGNTTTPQTKTGPTKVRHIRVPDGLWAAATEKANTQDEATISEVVKTLLRKYVNGEVRL